MLLLKGNPLKLGSRHCYQCSPQNSLAGQGPSSAAGSLDNETYPTHHPLHSPLPVLSKQRLLVSNKCSRLIAQPLLQTPATA